MRLPAPAFPRLALPLVSLGDLHFFHVLVVAGSMAGAARELGVTTAAVSKRLAALEARIGVALLARSTRRMHVTDEGELFLSRARALVAEANQLSGMFSGTTGAPRGLLRVNATLGFGRSHVGPALSRFVRQFPDVQARLELTVDPPPLADDAYDVCLRFGPPPDARVIARKVADNRRLLCASPAYLARAGVPQAPKDLAKHPFISIRQGDEVMGVLRLRKGRSGATESVKARSLLTTNDGSVAVQWALDGHGILLRAEWDIRNYLASGRLVEVLAQYRAPDANIYAIYPPRHRTTVRVQAFVALMAQTLDGAAK
jgi:LysR family transcriptional regulator, transcriptional activator for dmlA